MAVVINEFEVVAEPPPAPAAAADKQEKPAPPVPLDVERLLRRHEERQARVRAH